MRKHFQFIIIFLCILSSNLAKSQGYAKHLMVETGYFHQQKSFGELGARILLLKTDDVLYRFAAAALIGKPDDKWKVIPKISADVLLNFEKNVDLSHSYYFLSGADLTNATISPKIGVSLFGLLDFTGGYAFLFKSSTSEKTLDKGFNFAFTLNIPIVVLKKEKK